MSVKEKLMVVGPIQTNCYIIWDEETKIGAVIDPGGEPQKLIDWIDEHNLDIKWVLLTHGHFDHTFFAKDIANRYNCPIAMNKDDIEILENSLDVSEDYYYDMSKHSHYKPDKLLIDGDILEIGNSKIQVMQTPGHSPGGICFITDAGVFVGDSIFAGSIGRTDFPGGNHDLLINSIKTRILTLQDNIKLYSGHGPSSSVGEERTSNPYLQT